MRTRSSIALSAAALTLLLLGLAWVRASERPAARALAPFESAQPSPGLLPHGESSAAPEDPSAARERATPTDATAQIAELAPPEDMLTLAGRVIAAEQGLALPGAWVERFLPRDDERQPLRVDCDDQGAFRLRGLRADILDPPAFEGDTRPRGLRLRAGAPGLPARIFRLAAPEVDEELGLELALPSGESLRGLVLDLETGTPIPGASVSSSHLFSSDETQSDATGVFELAILREDATTTARVSAIAPGWCRVDRVFDEAGAPVAGAEVRVGRTWGDIEIGRDWGAELRARGVAMDGVSGQVTIDGGDRCVHSAGDGSFHTPDQVPWQSAVLVSARLVDGRAASAVLERLAAPGEPTRVELRLGRHAGGACVHGRLTLNGAPVERGTVIWRGATRRGYGALEADGRFLLVGVEPGQVELQPQPHYTIAPYSFRDQVATLELAPGEVRAHDLALERARGTIGGRVTRADGTPVAGVMLGARHAEAGGSIPQASDAAGRYLLELPDAALTYEVVAWWANEQHVRADVRAGSEQVDFVLPPAGHLRLTLLDATTDAPIPPDFDLEWRRAGEPEYRRATPSSRAADAAGRFEYALPVGRLDLVARAARIGYQPARTDGFELRSDATHELVLRLEPGLALGFRLAEGLGAPPRECTILLLEERAASLVRSVGVEAGSSFEGHPKLPGPALLDRRLRMWGSTGSALLNGLPPGRFRLRAFPDELAFEPETVELASDGPRLLELRWRLRAAGE